MEAPDNRINNSLTFSPKGCIFLFGRQRRGLSEDLVWAFSKSRSFFESPFFELSRFSSRNEPHHDRSPDDIGLL
jgi:hypothetical protein